MLTRVTSRPQPAIALAPTEEQTCLYIAQMSAELRDQARQRPRLRTLAYLLDMARLEAERTAEALRK